MVRIPIVTRYAVAVAAVACASLLRGVLTPALGPGVPFILYFPTVVVSAWFGGLGPGLVAALLGGLVAWYVFIPPHYSFGLLDPTAPAQLAVFLLSSVLISVLAERLHRAQQRAEAGVAHERAERERLRVTLASVGDAVIATDAAGRVTLMNPVAESLTGWRAGEAAGRRVDEVLVIVDERSRQAAENPVARVLAEGITTGLATHTVLLARDGREVPIDDSVAPIRTPDGVVVGAVMVFRDIMPRRRSEARQALQDAATRLLAESETVGDAVPLLAARIGEGLGWDAAVMWIADPDAGLLRCAAAWSRPTAKLDVFTASTGELTFASGVGLPGRVWASGEPVWLANPTSDSDFARAAGVHCTVLVPIQAGGQRWGVIQLVSQSPQPFDADVLVTLSSVASRVAHSLERRRAEGERARLLASEQAARCEAEAANRTKDEFLAMLSHELRTPLTNILGWARMLEMPRTSPALQERALASIARNAELQERLIEDLLDVSRIVSGKLTLELKPVDLGAVVDAAVDMLRGAADAAGVTLTVDVDRALPPLVGDAARLQQVVGNLVSNAVKFSDRGGRVEIGVRRVDDAIRLAVRDHGRGIAPELLPHVFDRFRQGAPTRGAGGLGLGLTIVRHLVALHGGTVAAVSPGEGQGTTVTVRLPLVSGLTAAARPPANLTDSQRAPSRAPSALAGVRILVVEDDADTRELLAAVLGGAQADVRSADSAERAREALARDAIDVIVSDISLAGEDGHALVAHVRACEAAGTRVPAIALTAHARDADRARALAGGFDAYVAKPVDPAELVSLIARAVRPRTE